MTTPETAVIVEIWGPLPPRLSLWISGTFHICCKF